MYLIDQDRIHVIAYDKRKDTLYTLPQISEGIYIGINLYCSDSFLGTFDCIQEALREMTSIQQCEDQHYFINDFKDWEAI